MGELDFLDWNAPQEHISMGYVKVRYSDDHVIVSLRPKQDEGVLLEAHIKTWYDIDEDSYQGPVLCGVKSAFSIGSLEETRLLFTVFLDAVETEWDRVKEEYNLPEDW